MGTAERLAAMPRRRNPHIDVMKGIGIMLVLVGHMRSLDYLGYSILGYSAMFNMPMFFFISGYLHPGATEAKLGFGRYVARKARTLAVPYAVFFFVSFLWSETVYAVATGGPLFGFAFTWQELVKAFFLAGEYLYNFPVVTFPIWFLHALFFASILFFFLVKLKSKLLLTVVGVGLAVAAVPLQELLKNSPLSGVWLLRLLPLALCYMLLGCAFRMFTTLPEPRPAPEFPPEKTELVGAFGALALFLVGLYCLRFGGGDMWSIASYWHFPGALIGIMSCFLLAKSVRSRLLEFVGVNSILYLGLHALVTRMPGIERLPEWFTAQGFDGIVVFLGYFVTTFFVITAVVFVGMLVRRGFQALLHVLRPHKKPVMTAGGGTQPTAEAATPPPEGEDAPPENPS